MKVAKSMSDNIRQIGFFLFNKRNILVLCFVIIAIVSILFNQEARAYELNFSTYIGGSGYEQTRDIYVDSQGYIYVVGGTASADFPTTPGAYDTTFDNRCGQCGSDGPMDVFVMKFDPNGQLIWSTYLGGPNYDRAYAVEVDKQGYVFIGGRAGDGFPTTAGTIQPNFGGDSDINHAYGPQDGFIAKLSPTGKQLIWATYFGGNDGSFFRDIDIDSQGNVYGALTRVSSPNPHITPGALQTGLSGGYDGVITKISADGTRVLWATYFGGSGKFDLGTPSIRVAPGDLYVYVSGGTRSPDIPTTPGAYDTKLGGISDIHIAKFSANGKFIFGTYLGGSDIEYGDTHNLAIDAQGNVIIAATTKSRDFPVTQNAWQRRYGGSGGRFNQTGDGFIAKLSSDGSRLLASTFLGGNSGEGLEGVGVDPHGNVYVTGGTWSANFPITNTAFQKNISGRVDGYLSKLSPDLSKLLYSTYIGGGNWDLGLSTPVYSDGTFYFTGQTNSVNWPTFNAFQFSFNGGKYDAVLVKLTVRNEISNTGNPD